MTVNRTTLLDLPLPVTGTESGTWGDTTNNGLTQYLDIAIAGTLVLSTDADVTLTSTEGDSSATNIGATTAQYAILRWTATGSTTRNITALAQSKTYVVINATGGTQSIVLRGAGPTTGVTIISGEKAHCVWNGSDFVKVSSSAAAGGSNTQVQYNSSGVLAGSSNLTFDGTSLTLGGNPTLSAGTANGVLYLNGSKVATSGSALTFDGTNLGLGTTSPNKNGLARAVTLNGSAGQFLGYEIASGDSSLAYFIAQSTTAAYLYTNTNIPIVFGVNNSEQMRLTSTGLGIGTSSPGAKLDVNGGVRLQGGNFLTLTTTGTTALGYIGSQFSILGAGSTSDLAIYNAQNGAMRLYTNGTERLTLDSSGNLGLGVTPSAWGSTYRAIDVASGANGGAAVSGFFSTNIVRNAYFDGTNWKAKYTADERPALYVQPYGGGHEWYNGNDFVTAGGNVTFTQAMTLDASGRLNVGMTGGTDTLNVAGSLALRALPVAIKGPAYNSENIIYSYYNAGDNTVYTELSAPNNNGGNTGLIFRAGQPSSGTIPERARITSGGDLLVGTTSTGYTNSNDFKWDAPGKYLIVDHASGVASGTGYILFGYGGGGVGSITQNGTTAVAYNTSSDYRLKDNPQPLTGSGAFIDALKPKIWNWKADGSRGVGFIAHEVQEVSPGSVVGTKDAVDADGKPVMQAMEYGSAEFIANIIAELQSLRQRVALLEGN